MKINHLLATAAIALLPLAAAAQAPVEGVTLVAPGKFAGAMQVKVVTTVDSIDAATRTVMLKTKQGEMVKVTAGDKVKNFAQIKVGDKVVTTYTQALIMELVKGGDGIRTRVEKEAQGSAAPGEKPAAYEAKQVDFTANVQAVNTKNKTITLQGAQKTVTMKIQDPKQLALIKKGDQVVGSYTEAVAIAVVAAPAKASSKAAKK